MTKVGIVLPSREAVMAGHADPKLMVECARFAEEAGYDSVWTGDSLFNRPRFEPLTMLAAVAASTTRIGVGTAVLLASMRQPLMLAHQLATLDRIAAGRLTLGVGAGWIQAEFEAVGVPFEQRLGRTVDTVRLCRALWSGEKPPPSKYWTFPDVELMPKPVSPGGPKFW